MMYKVVIDCNINLNIYNACLVCKQIKFSVRLRINIKNSIANILFSEVFIDVFVNIMYSTFYCTLLYIINTFDANRLRCPFRWQWCTCRIIRFAFSKLILSISNSNSNSKSEDMKVHTILQTKKIHTRESNPNRQPDRVSPTPQTFDDFRSRQRTEIRCSIKKIGFFLHN